MVMDTHRSSVKDGDAVRVWGGAETSRRRATAPRRQPPHGVGRHSPSLTHRRGRRQSAAAVALFLSKKGKHVRREAAGLPRAQRVSNASTSRCKLGMPNLTLDELRRITNNFSDGKLLGKGAFGKVYKGILRNGDMIAVKRFASTITGLEDGQYENEAQHLMRFKHPNIVRLLGYCSDSETEMELVEYNGKLIRPEKLERLLCLEYMPKGSLRDHLSDETSGLEWNTRYKIIEGICYGLHYLHEECHVTPIIHMDLKPANILLDDNMVPKIADFGLSRLFGEDQTRTYTSSCKGTRGYMPLEYIEKGVITKKYDIFSLGVIIIEIVTGLKDYPTDETETASQQYIDLVLNNWRNRLTKVQGYTSQDIDYQQIEKCIQIGLHCVKSDRVKRPTINQIIKMIERSDEAYKVKESCLIDLLNSVTFEPWITQSTQDVLKTPADPAEIPADTAMDMDSETLGYDMLACEDFGSFSRIPLESPQIQFSEMVNFAAPRADDGRRPWSTDADMAGVNADASPESQLAASPVPVGGGGHVAPWCATAGVLEVFAIFERWEEDHRRRFRSFKSAVECDLRVLLSTQWQLSNWLLGLGPEFLYEPSVSLDLEEAVRRISNQTKGEIIECTRSGIRLQRRCDNTAYAPWFVVPFTGPHSKGNKHHQQGRWEWMEKSIEGLRAVAAADPSSSPQPPPGQQQPQQEGYVGLKKTLELNHVWRACEYTPFVPSDDGASDKLVLAEFSLRTEFKDDPLALWWSPELPKSGDPKDGPKSSVWEHMTRVHVKVAATTTNEDGSQRKEPCYKVVYAICHHCHQVFNADSGQGTNNLSKHLDSCNVCYCNTVGSSTMSLR